MVNGVHGDLKDDTRNNQYDRSAKTSFSYFSAEDYGPIRGLSIGREFYANKFFASKYMYLVYSIFVLQCLYSYLEKKTDFDAEIVREKNL